MIQRVLVERCGGSFNPSGNVKKFNQPNLVIFIKLKKNLTFSFIIIHKSCDD